MTLGSLIIASLSCWTKRWLWKERPRGAMSMPVSGEVLAARSGERSSTADVALSFCASPLLLPWAVCFFTTLVSSGSMPKNSFGVAGSEAG